MLSYGYWQRRFGGDPSVIGRSIQVDAQTREIVGVMPRGFRIGDQQFDLLVPAALNRAELKLAPFCCDGIARMKPGVSMAQVDADMARLIPVWMDSWSNGPGTNPHFYEKWKITPAFRPLKQRVVGDVGSVLWVVMATVGLVMLIACTNIANLLLVRAESRHQELSIRAALGAGRARIARELLTESVSLGLMGGVLGIGVAYGGLCLLKAIGPADLPRLSEVSLDLRGVGFTLLLSVLSGLLFGSIPALRYARGKASTTIGSANRTASAGRVRQRSRNVLVVAQVAMALVLLISALLMIRTFISLRNVEPGFADAKHLQTMHIWIPDQLVPDATVATRMQNSIVEKLAAIPGVTSVGFAAAVPMENIDPNWDIMSVEGKQYPGGEPPIRLFNYVSPGYFRTAGTRMLAGRDFTWDDVFGLRPAVIVSENFARESWGSASAAIGKRVRQFSNKPWLQVVGVVEDVRMHGVDQDTPPVIYWPAMLESPYTPQPTIQAARAATFVIRTSRAGNEGFLGEMQRAVWSIDSNLPLAPDCDDAGYLQSVAGAHVVHACDAGDCGRHGAAAGDYGHLRRDFVCRVATDARDRDSPGAGRAQGRAEVDVRPVGTVAGRGRHRDWRGPAAVLMQLIKSLLFGISPLDPFTYLTVPLVLAVAAVVASYLPARRAAAVDPVDALRAE